MIPLTAKVIAQVESRNLLSGDVELDNFAKRFNKGAAAAVEQLKLFLLNKDCMKAFARPMTKHGLRLVKKHGFDPVSTHDRLEEGVIVFRIRKI